MVRVNFEIAHGIAISLLLLSGCAAQPGATRAADDGSSAPPLPDAAATALRAALPKDCPERIYTKYVALVSKRLATPRPASKNHLGFGEAHPDDDGGIEFIRRLFHGKTGGLYDHGRFTAHYLLDKELGGFAAAAAEYWKKHNTPKSLQNVDIFYADALPEVLEKYPNWHALWNIGGSAFLEHSDVKGKPLAEVYADYEAIVQKRAANAEARTAAEAKAKAESPEQKRLDALREQREKMYAEEMKQK